MRLSANTGICCDLRGGYTEEARLSANTGICGDLKSG
jgi:hypothetical protein